MGDSSASLIGRPLAEIAEMLQRDYHHLDDISAGLPAGKLIAALSTDPVLRAYPSEIRLVRPPAVLRVLRRIRLLYELVICLWLLGAAGRDTCILLDGRPPFGKLACILNSFIPFRKRKIVLCPAHIPNARYIPTEWLKRWLGRRMVLGSSLTVVFSRRQLDILPRLLKAPASKFVYMPYEAPNSTSPPLTLQIGGYIFSGGNSRRDYRTLFEAVRDTGIPVIVSATDPKACAGLDVPENVILVAAHEPAFTRLMAASRFVVVPIMPGLVRGAGEATVCGAMWQSRAVICADDISIFEYIDEGVTGFVTPPGDAVRLREQIVELWTHPTRAAEMGRAAFEVVSADRTDRHYCRRLRALGILVAMAK
ncbi:MAG: hypothetical protein Kow00124_09110 [Anaerolineae bacterium]